MSLHTSAVMSRRALDHPDEPPVAVLPYERVLKYNPNHDPQTGRFAPSSGGRRGGTEGPPREDAFGNAFGRPRRSAEAAAFGGGVSLPDQRKAAMKETYRKMRAGEGGLGYTPQRPPSDIQTLPYRPGDTPATAQNLPYRPGDTPSTVENLPFKAPGLTPYTSGGVMSPYKPAVNPAKIQIENAAGPGFQFSNEQRRRHAQAMFGPRVPSVYTDTQLKTQGWGDKQIGSYRQSQATNWLKGRKNLPK